MFVHRPETTSISKESSGGRIKKEPVPRYMPRDRSNHSYAQSAGTFDALWISFV
jgi:hypothetical protein